MKPLVAVLAVLVATSCSEAERDLAETSSPALETTDTLRASAEQGDATAQLVLAMGYEHGNGVPQDYVLAHMWYNLAASRETGEVRYQAVQGRNIVAERMSADQLAEAQRLARDWDAAHPRWAH